MDGSAQACGRAMQASHLKADVRAFAVLQQGGKLRAESGARHLDARYGILPVLPQDVQTCSECNGSVLLP